MNNTQQCIFFCYFIDISEENFRFHLSDVLQLLSVAGGQPRLLI